MEFASLVPLAGGWSGETFLASAGEGPGAEQHVVRIYARRPTRVEVDAALLRLVRGLLPVAEVVEVRPAAGETPALLVTSYLTGERGDLVIPSLDESGLAALGTSVGELVATLGGMPTARAGDLVGPDLRIEAWDAPDGLSGFVQRHLAHLGHWTHDERDGLVEVADTAQDLLDTVGRTCLVHSDVNPKNLLVDPDTLQVVGLVDWEYAHAGHPFTDLGNVLRFERHPAYVDAVLAAYHHRRGTAPDAALDLARAADLWALVDLASRRDSSPVAARADDLLRAVAGRGDVHAFPPDLEPCRPPAAQVAVGAEVPTPGELDPSDPRA